MCVLLRSVAEFGAPIGRQAALRRVLTDERLCDELRSRGFERAGAFSRDRNAKETLRLYEQVPA